MDPETIMTDTHSAVVAAEGHLVDSQQLKAIFDKVIERGGAFEVQHFALGRTNDEFSRLTLKVEAPSEPALEDLLEELLPFGCHAVDVQDATVRVGREGRLRAGRLLLHDQPAHRTSGSAARGSRSSGSGWMRSIVLD